MRKSAEIKNQRKEAESRIRTGAEKIAKYMVSAGLRGDDLSLTDFEKFEGFMRDEGYDAYLGADTEAKSKERQKKITKIFKEAKTGNIGLATGIAGFIITVLQGIYHLKKNLIYIPLWKKGKNDKQRAYKLVEGKHEYLLNSVKGKQICDIGLLFGIEQSDGDLIVQNVLPLSVIREKVRSQLHVSGLREKILDSLNTVMAEIEAGGENSTCRRSLSPLLELLFTEYHQEPVFKQIGLNLDKKNLLGVYYFNPTLLEQSFSVDQAIEKFRTGSNANLSKIKKKNIVRNLRRKIDEYKEKIIEELKMDSISATPKVFFFTTNQFKKVDHLLKGLLPFFIKNTTKNRPILVCIDQNEKMMCMGYRTNEKIYKRLRYYPDV
ncbi:MAG: hypothetical protein ABIF92_01800 [archaeon]